MSNEISEVTRRAIIDRFDASGISWSGRLADDEFLARLYDLAALHQMTTGITMQLEISINTAFAMMTGTTIGYFTTHVSISCAILTTTSCVFSAKPFIPLSGLPWRTRGSWQTLIMKNLLPTAGKS